MATTAIRGQIRDAYIQIYLLYISLAVYQIWWFYHKVHNSYNFWAMPPHYKHNHDLLPLEAMHSAARSFMCGVRPSVRPSVRLFVCLSLWCIETAKLTVNVFHRLVAPLF